MAAVKEVALAQRESGAITPKASTVPETFQAAVAALPGVDPQAKAILQAFAIQDPDMASRIIAVMAGSPVAKPVPFRLAFYAADRERRTGEQLGRDFYVSDEIGFTPSTQGIIAHATRLVGPVSYRFTGVTEEEAAERELVLDDAKPDMALAIEITVQRDYQAGMAAHTVAMRAYRETLETLRVRAAIIGQVLTAADLPPMPQLLWKPVRAIGVIKGKDLYQNTLEWFTDNEGKKHKTILPREKWGARREPDFTNWTWRNRVEYRALRAGFKLIPGVNDDRLPDAEPPISFDLPPLAGVGTAQMMEAMESERARQKAEANLAAQPAAEQAAAMEKLAELAYGPADEELPLAPQADPEAETENETAENADPRTALIDQLRLEAQTEDTRPAAKDSISALRSQLQAAMQLSAEQADALLALFPAPVSRGACIVLYRLTRRDQGRAEIQRLLDQ